MNRNIASVGFKIPELWDPKFLDGFPLFPRKTAQAHTSTSTTPAGSMSDVERLRQDSAKLYAMDPHQRGFAFERFLRELLDAFGLKGRSSFRLVGEQIDGSFTMGDDTYLIEAKWENKPLDVTPLLAFKSQVAKADWSRGCSSVTAASATTRVRRSLGQAS